MHFLGQTKKEPIQYVGAKVGLNECIFCNKNGVRKVKALGKAVIIIFMVNL